jgi:leucyl aminopeptidase
MRVRASRKKLSELEADIVACFAYEGDKSPRGVADTRLRRELAAEMKAEGFRGLRSDVVIWNANGRYGSRRFMVVGLGKPGSVPGEAIRVGCARASRAASGIKARSLALRLPPFEGEREFAETRAAIEGAVLGSYRFDRFLTDPDRKPVKLARVEVSSDLAPNALGKASTRAQVVGRAVCLARDLVNAPPSLMNPGEVARVATSEARKHGLQCKVMKLPEIRRLGLRAMMAVGRGGHNQPRLVHLVYRPERRRRNAPKVLLVGKGVTFDSGGLNLKPGGSMETMKSDMAGSAAVLGAMTALKDLGCRAEVHGMLGLVENMTGAEAYKPGDILETWLGKTVEVGNTDAEGRLVLADVLAWGAKKVKPTCMVDLATLTGACVVALGTLAAGVFSRDDHLRNEILEAGSLAGEKLWPLPMYEEYLEPMQKGPADLRNIGDRWGGAISAALFLGEFVPKTIPWLHMDIAGPAFLEKPLPEAPSGGTGAGVRSLVRWLETL